MGEHSCQIMPIYRVILQNKIANKVLTKPKITINFVDERVNGNMPVFQTYPRHKQKTPQVLCVVSSSFWPCSYSSAYFLRG